MELYFLRDRIYEKYEKFFENHPTIPDSERAWNTSNIPQSTIVSMEIEMEELDEKITNQESYTFNELRNIIEYHEGDLELRKRHWIRNYIILLTGRFVDRGASNIHELKQNIRSHLYQLLSGMDYIYDIFKNPIPNAS